MATTSDAEIASPDTKVAASDDAKTGAAEPTYEIKVLPTSIRFDRFDRDAELDAFVIQFLTPRTLVQVKTSIESMFTNDTWEDWERLPGHTLEVYRQLLKNLEKNLAIALRRGLIQKYEK